MCIGAAGVFVDFANPMMEETHLTGTLDRKLIYKVGFVFVSENRVCLSSLYN
jgi:hypothetical protein